MITFQPISRKLICFLSWFVFLVLFMFSQELPAQTNNAVKLTHFGSKGNDIINQMVGAGKNIFLVGSFSDTISFGTTRLVSLGLFDGFLAKADSNGNIKWVSQIGGKLNDNITSVIVDKFGNSFVVGYFQKKAKSGSGTFNTKYFYSNFLAKFNPQGKQIWLKKFDKHNQLSNCLLASDTLGHIYLTGNFTDTLYLSNFTILSHGSTDIFILKTDTSGKQIWLRTIGGKGTDLVNTILVDKSCNILLGGSFEDFIIHDNLKIVSCGKKDALLARIDSLGNIFDLKRYGGLNDEEITSITQDGKKTIYAVGNFSDSTTFGHFHINSHGRQDAFLAALDKTSEVKWINPIGGAGDDGCVSVHTTQSGNVVVCGTFKRICFFQSTENLIKVDSLSSHCSFNNTYIGTFDSTGILLNKYQINSSAESLGRNIVSNNDDLYMVGTFRTDLTINILNHHEELVSFGNKDIFLLKISDKCSRFFVKINVDTVYINKTKTYVLNAGSGYLSYLWNDTIFGSQYLSTTIPGKYKVLVTNEIGCIAKDSVIIYDQQFKELADSSVTNLSNASNILVYPNPTTGQLIIKLLSDSDFLRSIELFDYCGKLIHCQDGIKTTQFSFDLTDRPPGVYYLRINSTNLTKCTKIVKNE
jgi:hypothetical protein